MDNVLLTVRCAFRFAAESGLLGRRGPTLEDLLGRGDPTLEDLLGRGGLTLED